MSVKKLMVLFTVAALAGIAAGHYEKSKAESATEPIVHVVEKGETVWNIARPIADAKNEDIRDTICQMMADNDISIDAVIYPGQKIIIK